MKEKLVSIILTVYNTERYLEKCINSIINQSYKNIEIILVDDGSLDNSGKICDEFEKKYSFIKVIHKKNEGVSIARNIGFDESHGDFIIFIDSDDYIKLDMISYMYNKIIENDADMVCCGYINKYPDKEYHNNPGNCLCDTKSAIKKLITDSGFYTVIWNKLFKRSVLYKNGQFIGFKSDIHIGEDGVWLVEVIKNCKKIICIEQEFYVWYRRDDSATSGRSFDVSDRALTSIDAYNIMAHEIKSVDRLTYKTVLKYGAGVARTKLFGAYCINDVKKKNKIFKVCKYMVSEYKKEFYMDYKFIIKYYITIYMIKFGFNKKIVKRVIGKFN